MAGMALTFYFSLLNLFPFSCFGLNKVLKATLRHQKSIYGVPGSKIIPYCCRNSDLHRSKFLIFAHIVSFSQIICRNKTIPCLFPSYFVFFWMTGVYELSVDCIFVWKLSVWIYGADRRCSMWSQRVRALADWSRRRHGSQGQTCARLVDIYIYVPALYDYVRKWLRHFIVICKSYQILSNQRWHIWGFFCFMMVGILSHSRFLNKPPTFRFTTASTNVCNVPASP